MKYYFERSEWCWFEVTKYNTKLTHKISDVNISFAFSKKSFQGISDICPNNHCTYNTKQHVPAIAFKKGDNWKLLCITSRKVNLHNTQYKYLKLLWFKVLKWSCHIWTVETLHMQWCYLAGLHLFARTGGWWPNLENWLKMIIYQVPAKLK